MIELAKKQRGRPLVPDDQRRDRTVRARVTAEEEAKWLLLGGAKWLRAVLRRAKLTQNNTQEPTANN